MQPVLMVLGLLLGFTLFHARFGFTSAFRRLMSVGNGEAIRAHMVMLGTATVIFAPILALGISFFGAEVTGYVSPIGVSLIVGAFYSVSVCSSAGVARPVHCIQSVPVVRSCSLL